jgi:hypothetical protein
MFDRIDPNFFAAYMPPPTHNMFTLARNVLKIFYMDRKTCNSSSVIVADGTRVISFQIYDILMRLWRGMQDGCRIDEVKDVPPFVPNWYEVIPDFYKSMGGSKTQNGQAKIMYSVIAATTSVPDGSACHIVVPGAGMQEYGWSYNAIAMILSDRQCHGRMDLYDPIGQNGTKVVGKFTLNFFAEKVPTVFAKSVTHILDDTFPSAVNLKAVAKAIDDGVVVSMKTNVQQIGSRLNNEVILHKAPLRLFQQPFYNGSERRVVYNYKPRQVRRNLSSCCCYDCLKTQSHPIIEEEWHHLIGFGVKPCFAVKGREMIASAYGFYTGRKRPEELIDLPLTSLPKMTKYLATLPRVTTPEISHLEEKILLNRGREARELWCVDNHRGADHVLAYSVELPLMVSKIENTELVRKYFSKAQILETDSFLYVTKDVNNPNFSY